MASMSIYLIEAFPSLDGDLSPPEPVPVEVGEAVDNDRNREDDGKCAEDSAEATNQFAHARHRSYCALNKW